MLPSSVSDVVKSVAGKVADSFTESLRRIIPQLIKESLEAEIKPKSLRKTIKKLEGKVADLSSKVGALIWTVGVTEIATLLFVGWFGWRLRRTLKPGRPSTGHLHQHLHYQVPPPAAAAVDDDNQPPSPPQHHQESESGLNLETEAIGGSPYYHLFPGVDVLNLLRHRPPGTTINRNLDHLQVLNVWSGLYNGPPHTEIGSTSVALAKRTATEKGTNKESALSISEKSHLESSINCAIDTSESLPGTWVEHAADILSQNHNVPIDSDVVEPKYNQAKHAFRGEDAYGVGLEFGQRSNIWNEDSRVIFDEEVTKGLRQKFDTANRSLRGQEDHEPEASGQQNLPQRDELSGSKKEDLIRWIDDAIRTVYSRNPPQEPVFADVVKYLQQDLEFGIADYNGDDVVNTLRQRYKAALDVLRGQVDHESGEGSSGKVLTDALSQILNSF